MTGRRWSSYKRGARHTGDGIVASVFESPAGFGPDSNHFALRVFSDASLPGDPPSVAEYVKRVLDDSRRGRPAVVVTGAGVGALDGRFDARDTDAVRAAHTALGGWGQRFASSLPSPHPPVLVGVDGYSSAGDAVVQAIVAVSSANLLNITLKSTPLGGERDVLLNLRLQRGLLAANTVRNNNHFGECDGLRFLSLICHDLTSFARTRWLPSQTRTSLFARLRSQFRGLLLSDRRSRVAVSVWHGTRWPSSGAIPSSFLNGAANLHAGIIPVVRETGILDARIPALPVIAVSRVGPSGGSEAEFLRLAAAVPCHWPSVDAWIRAGS
jgi:hypothetical protein